MWRAWSEKQCSNRGEDLSRKLHQQAQKHQRKQTRLHFTPSIHCPHASSPSHYQGRWQTNIIPLWVGADNIGSLLWRARGQMKMGSEANLRGGFWVLQEGFLVPLWPGLCYPRSGNPSYYCASYQSITGPDRGTTGRLATIGGETENNNSEIPLDLHGPLIWHNLADVLQRCSLGNTRCATEHVNGNLKKCLTTCEWSHQHYTHLHRPRYQDKRVVGHEYIIWVLNWQLFGGLSCEN